MLVTPTGSLTPHLSRQACGWVRFYHRIAAIPAQPATAVGPSHRVVISLMQPTPRPPRLYGGSPWNRHHHPHSPALFRTSRSIQPDHRHGCKHVGKRRRERRAGLAYRSAPHARFPHVAIVRQPRSNAGVGRPMCVCTRQRFGRADQSANRRFVAPPFQTNSKRT